MVNYLAWQVLPASYDNLRCTVGGHGIHFGVFNNERTYVIDPAVFDTDQPEHMAERYKRSSGNVVLLLRGERE